MAETNSVVIPVAVLVGLGTVLVMVGLLCWLTVSERTRSAAKYERWFDEERTERIKAQDSAATYKGELAAEKAAHAKTDQRRIALYNAVNKALGDDDKLDG